MNMTPVYAAIGAFWICALPMRRAHRIATASAIFVFIVSYVASAS